MGKYNYYQPNNQDVLEESANEGPLLNQRHLNDSSQQQQKSLQQSNSTSISVSPQTTKREHTTPDVLDSVLHKTIKSITKPNKQLSNIFSEQTKRYNKGTFCRLIIIAKKAGISPHKIKSQFIKNYQRRIESKSKKWRSKRLEEADKIYQQFLKAFDAKTVKGQLSKIWNDRTSDPRFTTCLNEVRKFQKKINVQSKQLFKQ